MSIVRMGEIVSHSTIDWPGHISTVVFLAACPFNCIYCSNYKLLNEKKNTGIDRIYREIEKNKDFIDSVVFSGGEPTLQCEALYDCLAFAKVRGLKTAIHTNGYYPSTIDRLARANLIDGIMLDIKAPLDEVKYEKITKQADCMERINESINICDWLRRDHIINYFEVRTVIFKGINDTVEEIQSIYDNLPVSCDAFVLVKGITKIMEHPEQLEEIGEDELQTLAFKIEGKNIYTRSDLGYLMVK